ncbi:MAG: ribosomal protein S18-alanine N-acetyltransferase [Betaproteobacteria bacterium]|nr:ribosomal protein S18-alanine N-acetyltransferase [Betaproteobacteria bacterium]
MRQRDLDEVAAAEATLFDFPWTRGNFADSLQTGHSAWVCRVDRALAGYGIMLLALDEAHLLNLSVLKPWQGRGYARGMLRHFFRTARRNGATRMYLEVRPSNSRAIALYQDFGFVRVGLRRGYYPAGEGREDALVMASDIPP